MYSGVFECRIKEEGGRYTIVIVHELGRKWSEFIMLAMDRALEIIGVAPEFEIQEGVVVAKVSVATDKEFVTPFKTQRR
ncbi:MAG: hypothetical protein HYU02_02170 [Thaumarchaeota archaeon]|nr:hypothetical protein [Nitrososphaerota archaeon]